MFAEWLAYFQSNRVNRLQVPWERGVSLRAELRQALVPSLQSFQLGESGDGRHLKKVAASTRDPDYIAAIELFVAEEQEHARLMGELLRGLGAPLLQSHWSDRFFRLFCLLSDLRLELMLIVVTELIAKRYFRVVRDASGDQVTRIVCEQILRDEEGHIAFHCAALEPLLAKVPALLRPLLRAGWRLFFEAVVLVVAHDHRKLLQAAGVAPGRFRQQCRTIFRGAVAKAFGDGVASREWAQQK